MNYTIELTNIPAQKVTVQAGKTALAVLIDANGNLTSVLFLTHITTLPTDYQIFNRLGDVAVATQGAEVDVLSQLDLEYLYEQLTEYGEAGLLDPASEISYLLESLAEGEFKNRLLLFLAQKA